MLKIIIDAKAAAFNATVEHELRVASKKNNVDRSETCFAGKGNVPLNDFYKSMSVASDMKKKSFW